LPRIVPVLSSYETKEEGRGKEGGRRKEKGGRKEDGGGGKMWTGGRNGREDKDGEIVSE
jgi:hypothetical protein